MRNLFVIALIATLAACGQQRTPTPPPTPSVIELTSDSDGGMAKIASILALPDPPPTQIGAAHLVQEQLGDGNLGPSDYRTFASLEVPSAELDRWRSMLTAMDQKPAFVAPSAAADWWPSSESFAQLEFYEPGALGPAANGWTAIDPFGRVLVYTFTT